MEEIKSLKGINFDDIFEAFNEAFKDYEVQQNKVELQNMLHRRGFVPELSFAVFKNNKIVSFTCNGIGMFDGGKTAYDTGTGTIKEYRGQGYANKIFLYSIPFLKDAGISKYLLEVLQHNNKAVSIYSKLGFEVSREFNYYVQANEDIKLCSKILDFNYEITFSNVSQAQLLSSSWDFNPSWQNSFEAILRDPDRFKVIGVYEKQNLLAYSIFESISGDIAQIFVDKRYRRKGVGTLLIRQILKLNKYNSVKILNTEVECESITKFLEANSFIVRGKQFEMIKLL